MKSTEVWQLPMSCALLVRPQKAYAKRKRKSSNCASGQDQEAHFPVFILLDLTAFSNAALVEEGLLTAFHHLMTGNAASATKA
eukprot:595320-Amphidinium_carterae.1